ncbi:unnamed protein product [Nesidiocoris tenuis]|uniref:EF-hand domain-containing protein n=1 Tax=Nesidiocoris tenuis TaxID=355587 RepID=A0A6H5GNR1_9HEMI|nr:unnamed protein product [Nesidiocoris tenuis]
MAIAGTIRLGENRAHRYAEGSFIVFSIQTASNNSDGSGNCTNIIYPLDSAVTRRCAGAKNIRTFGKNIGKNPNRRGSNWVEAEVEEGEPLPPRARPESLKSLTRVTRFTEAELKRIYRGFKAECPSGLVKEDTFRCIYSQFFPQGANSSQYATYVFHTLDQANTGTLSFQDLVRGLSVLCRGSVEERLKWTFTLYDINKDGKITREELADVITSVYNLLGRLSPLQCDEDHETLASKIDVIFQRLDQNNDGVVTWEEFLEACTADETITSSMAVFDSAI